MSLAQTFRPQLLDQNQVMDEARQLAQAIRHRISPLAIILFGSAAEGRFKAGSDFDLLLVFEDSLKLREARYQLRQGGTLTHFAPLDLIFVSQAVFDQKKDLGGICFIANHEGVNL